MNSGYLVARESTAVLDAVRCPYTIDRHARANVVGRAGAMSWPSEHALASLGLDAYELDGFRLFSRVLDQRSTARTLAAIGGSWHCEHEITTLDGTGVSGVWRSSDDHVFLPFDPASARRILLDEGYLDVVVDPKHRRVQSAAHSLYYRLRGLIPRQVQLAMRRRYLVAQDRTDFPRWPTETSLHHLDAFLLDLIETIGGEPLPWIAPWPEPYSWALVLTHDVEREAGYERLPAVLACEAERGLRSACFFVPERDYVVELPRLQELQADGFEIGLHGLRHDGRDLSEGVFDERVDAMRGYADAWGATGFRSPATHRDRGRLGRLGLDYDSTYSDVARFEPQPGGACTWFPYFLDSLVELPITMPMDHLLFDLFGHESDELWVEKCTTLRENGGMALMLTHPDYLLDDSRLDVYAGFLDRWANDTTAWHALPRDTAGWWRARWATTLVRDGDDWGLSGPAASRARVVRGAPPRPGRVDQGLVRRGAEKLAFGPGLALLGHALTVLCPMSA